MAVRKNAAESARLVVIPENIAVTEGLVNKAVQAKLELTGVDPRALMSSITRGPLRRSAEVGRQLVDTVAAVDIETTLPESRVCRIVL